MRKIKFRFWDVVKEEMSDVALMIDGDGKIYEWDSYGMDSDETIRYILMQYTGLKDKNGKEIYEGDIVRDSNGYMGWIEWIAPKFKVAHKQVDYKSFSIVNDEEIFDWYVDYVSLRKNLWEIIGNIHENPELLDDIK